MGQPCFFPNAQPHVPKGIKVGDLVKLKSLGRLARVGRISRISRISDAKKLRSLNRPH